MLTSALTTFSDIQSAWYKKQLEFFQMKAVAHRKQWELMSCIQCFEENGMLQEGKRGLVFGVGTEPFPYIFSSRGCSITATDAPTELSNIEDWKNTDQHCAGKEKLYIAPDIPTGDKISEEIFNERVDFRYVDMNSIPEDLYGKYDFVWSICALEHLGSIERGIEFIKNSIKCLKPGGIFFHTTEFNVLSNDETLDNDRSVYFRRRDIEDLKKELNGIDVSLSEVNYDTGNHEYDTSYAYPPYPSEPHLKVAIGSFVVTCIRLIGRKNMRKLEIGSGSRPLEGYEHLDINPKCPHLEYIAPMDKIPTEDNTFDEVIAVHVLEHQSWRKAASTLSEWKRVLKKDGKLRIAVPNLRWIMQCYNQAQSNDNTEWHKDLKVMVDEETVHLTTNGEPNVALWANFKIMSSGIEFDQHFACFDATLLTSLLKQVGFSTVKIVHDGDSLVVEAWK